MACPGADVIVQAMLQCFVNMADFAMTPQQAVEAPRLAAYSFPAGFHPHGEHDRRVRVEDQVPEPVAGPTSPLAAIRSRRGRVTSSTPARCRPA